VLLSGRHMNSVAASRISRAISRRWSSLPNTSRGRMREAGFLYVEVVDVEHSACFLCRSKHQTGE
jgi:hypothetical protein